MNTEYKFNEQEVDYYYSVIKKLLDNPSCQKVMKVLGEN